MNATRQQRTKANPPSLTETQVYRDYWKAFTHTSGLPLRLRTPAEIGVTLPPGKQASPFCSLLARGDVSCKACPIMQQQLGEEVQVETKTLICFAGMCETAVPVRVGDNLVGWLETGQILVDRPSKSKFTRVAKTLLRWGTNVDLQDAEKAYFDTRVISRSQYDSAVELLKIFATHLAQVAQEVAIKHQDSEPFAVQKAREWIDVNYGDSISLGSAARVVNLSAKHFSEIFHKSTGITFVEYVTRVRLEKAKNLLTKSQHRISEIAFEVGFQSLSQFNRAFRHHEGKSPREYRRSLHSEG